MVLQLDGRPYSGCPVEEAGMEAMEARSAWEEWEKGIHPVALGQAPWLPRRFVETMRFIGACVAENRSALRAVAERRSAALAGGR